MASAQIYRSNAFFFKSLDALRSRVIELSSLTNLKASRAQNENSVGADACRPGNAGQHVGSHLAGTLVVPHLIDEDIEQVLCVQWTAPRLRVELHSHEGFGFVENTLIRTIVVVLEKFVPLIRERSSHNCKAVVLRGDVASSCMDVDTRLIDSAVTITQFLDLGTFESLEENQKKELV